jgi:16S rRNA (adenine1518-N6/adenine1519-N6)-dimethyltransferase
MKRKGQHFLIDQKAIEKIVLHAELKVDDTVLEIGSGTGNLTEALAARAGRVFAVEVDPDLAASLKGRFDNVEVISGDALKIKLPQYNKVVSNLPYQISSRVTYRLLSRPFDLAVLMYQREFAKKMIARPGSRNYGRISMVVGYLAWARIVEHVHRSAFLPVPNVDSAVVRLLPREHDVEPSKFMRLAERLFSHRRKKVRKALEAAGAAKESLTSLPEALLDKRPEELTQEEAAQLAAEIFKPQNQIIK